MKKRILLDLQEINNPTSGFGQICKNYAEIYKEMEDDQLQFHFLLPRGYEADFGGKVTTSNRPKRRKWWQLFAKEELPAAYIWHSTNQQQIKRSKGESEKFVLTIHDLNYLTEKNWLRQQKHHFFLQRAIDKADAVTCISKFVAKQIEEQFDMKGKRVQTIYNGVEDISQEMASKPAFASGRPFFFAIGQIREKKNFHLLVDMMKQFPDHDLYVCGDDHFKFAKVVREHIAKLPTNNAYLCGKISQAEKVWLYQHCEAFLFASQGEGFGLPAIEAMQFGKAVFISSYTCLPEICGDCAFVWRELDPEKMAAFVKEHLPHAHGEDFAMKLKAHAAEFSYAKHIEQYMQLYHSLL